MDIFSKITSLKDKIIIAIFAVFVFSVLVGLLSILFGNSSDYSKWGHWTEKVVQSLLMLTIAVVVLIDNLRKISSDNKWAKILGLCSFIFGTICLVLGLLLLWNKIPSYYVSSSCPYCDDIQYHPTIFSEIIVSMVFVEALFFFGSNVLSIKENGQKIVRLMKIAAMIFLGLGVIAGICGVNNIGIESGRAGMISNITATSFVGMTIAAFLTSKFAPVNKKEGD